MQRDFPASVREVVLSGFLGGMGAFPFYTRCHKRKANEIMQKLEISHIAKKCYHELSGGQQQRVLLARALCAAKKLLIMDEPTSALDSSAVNEFYELISNLSDEGMTIIMISHDIENAVRYANSVLHLGEAEALFFGSSEEYINKFKECISDDLNTANAITDPNINGIDKNSKMVMDLLKELSKDHLIIVVTHSDTLAHEYADRLIEIRDGSVIKDTGNNGGLDKDLVLDPVKVPVKTSLSLSINISLIVL